MKCGRTMIKWEIYNKLEKARHLCDKGMALINESMEKMETEWELSQKIFDEGTSLWARVVNCGPRWQIKSSIPKHNTPRIVPFMIKCAHLGNICLRQFRKHY